MKKTWVLIFGFIFSHALAADNWHIDTKVEGGLDTLKVYDSAIAQQPILIVRAQSLSQGFIGADEVFIRSVNKRFLVTRWTLGVIGSETIRIYDPARRSSKEVYKLQSMPTTFIVKNTGIIFIIPTGPGENTTTEWIAK